MNPVETYFAYDARKKFRSIADAVDHFRKLDPQHPVEAVIRTGELRLPNRTTCRLVTVVRNRRTAPYSYRIQMPNSFYFNARFLDGTATRGETADLHDAQIDDAGVITLETDQAFRSLDLQPGPPSHYEFNDRQDAIIRKAINILGKDAACYRPLDPDLLPNMWLLDYAQVADVRIAKLGELKYEIQNAMPEVEYSEIAEALRLSGMKFPRD